jgi:hypothetical protein
MRIAMHSRQEVVRESYQEYQKASKKGMQALLDRLMAVTGLNRDYLAHILANYRETAEVVIDGKPVKLKAVVKRKAREAGKRGGRPSEYGTEAFVKVLIAIWEDHGQMCGKLLVPLIRSTIDFLAASTKPDYGISDEIRGMLLRVSPAEVDILLKPARKA